MTNQERYDLEEDFRKNYHLDLYAITGVDRVLIFMSNQILSLSVSVDTATREFQLQWIPPGSPFCLSSGKAGPVTSKSHFDRMYQRFVETIQRFH